MKYLFDTHLLLWAAAMPERLREKARAILLDDSATVFFSAASIWEVAIKSGLGRADFRADARILRRGLLESDYEELAISSRHAAEIASLPEIHRDPFDRILVAQAIVEGVELVTSDAIVARYPGPIAKV